MNNGDILMMSRPLGVGIYFSGQMQNINMLGSASEIINNTKKYNKDFLTLEPF